ncbi:hypothetical protein HanRHA438_Chr15g0724841 [Helianthus annuus]|nr:hypothetical protein HanRHA438_Chr15g0724841 [Helianthus annuus]
MHIYVGLLKTMHLYTYTLEFCHSKKKKRIYLNFKCEVHFSNEIFCFVHKLF